MIVEYIILKTVAIKSLTYGLLAGGTIEAVGESTGGSSLTYGLYPLIGVIAVALITAFVNLKIAKNNSGIDMKEHRRLIRENKAKDKIIEALIAKAGENDESKAQAS